MVLYCKNLNRKRVWVCRKRGRVQTSAPSWQQSFMRLLAGTTGRNYWQEAPARAGADGNSGALFGLLHLPEHFLARDLAVHVGPLVVFNSVSDIRGAPQVLLYPVLPRLPTACILSGLQLQARMDENGQQKLGWAGQGLGKVVSPVGVAASLPPPTPSVFGPTAGRSKLIHCWQSGQQRHPCYNTVANQPFSSVLPPLPSPHTNQIGLKERAYPYQAGQPTKHRAQPIKTPELPLPLSFENRAQLVRSPSPSSSHQRVVALVIFPSGPARLVFHLPLWVALRDGGGRGDIPAVREAPTRHNTQGRLNGWLAGLWLCGGGGMSLSASRVCHTLPMSTAGIDNHWPGIMIRTGEG